MAMARFVTALTHVRNHWPRSRPMSPRRVCWVTRIPPFTGRVEARATGPGRGTPWSARPRVLTS